MELTGKLKGFIDNQYKSPKGLIGTFIGEKMVRQHKPETVWTIDLLQIKKEEKVLELGCGSGYAMKFILEKTKAHQIVGLDLSPAVIRSSRLRNKKALREGRAKLVQADVRSLPFEDSQFEKVFSIHTIYFWDQLSETTSEIFRVLKPNGSCIITLCNGKNGELWEGVNNMIHEQFIPYMKNCGFDDVELLNGPDSRQFQTVAIAGKKLEMSDLL